MEKKFANVFTKVLVFEPVEDGCPAAYFIDKRNRSAIVIGNERTVVGLRYVCKLDTSYEKLISGISYKLLRYHVQVDNLEVVPFEGGVYVMLDGEPVSSLTFDKSCGSDYASKVKELKEYFINKTFQLGGRRDIDEFVSLFYTSCIKALGGKTKISI